MLAACGTSPPRTPNDLCGIFREKDDWYDAAKVTQKRWGVPIQVPFAIMYQESGFHQDALAPRKYLLWIIPWGRVSTAAGYAQAKDEVWNDYRKSTVAAAPAGRTSTTPSTLSVGTWTRPTPLTAYTNTTLTAST
jgi:hypothetical protein